MCKSIVTSRAIWFAALGDLVCCTYVQANRHITSDLVCCTYGHRALSTGQLALVGYQRCALCAVLSALVSLCCNLRALLSALGSQRWALSANEILQSTVILGYEGINIHYKCLSISSTSHHRFPIPTRIRDSLTHCIQGIRRDHIPFQIGMHTCHEIFVCQSCLSPYSLLSVYLLSH